MKRLAIALVGALSVLLCRALQPHAADLEQVAVGEHTRGQAFLVGHLGRCFAVLPSHVMNDRCGANLTAPTSRPVLGHGALFLTSDPDGEDLALLEVSGALAESCGPQFGSLKQDLQDVLKRSDHGVISTVDPAGGRAIVRLPVLIEDVQEKFLWVAPQRDDTDFAKGISGAVLGVNDIAVGMILGLDTSNGAARALRMDVLMAAINSFFSADSADPGPFRIAEHCTNSASPEITDDTSDLDVAAAANGAQLIYWSVPLHDPDQTPSAILSGHEEVLWQATRTTYPVEFVIDLAGDSPVIIRRIEISSAPVPSAEAMPRHLEVYGSAATAGRSWHHIQSLVMLPSDSVVVLHTAPKRARRIKLRVHDNYGHPFILNLARLGVFASPQSRKSDR